MHLIRYLDLVLPLEVLEGEAAEDAVTHDEGEEADVGEEEGEEPPDRGEAPGQAADVGLLLCGHRPRALRPRVWKLSCQLSTLHHPLSSHSAPQ